MTIEINTPILQFNDRLAAENRSLLSTNRVFMLDVLASPGAGKTSLILAAIEALRTTYRIAVIEGDVASDVDAQRVKQANIEAVQINTNGACHLEAAMVARALEALDLAALDLIIVENVGNLVCPTEFDIGSNCRIVVASVPEGDDKPLKYPAIFSIVEAVLVNKIDTLPVFDFDLRAFTDVIFGINPTAPVMALSAKTGEGLNVFTDWLVQRINQDV